MDKYDEIALNCFRYLDYRSFDEVDKLTMKEYRLLMKACEYKRVDKEYWVHLGAYLTVVAKAEKRVGRTKSKPVYNTFKKFYDYESALKKVKGDKPNDSRIERAFEFYKLKEEGKDVR